MDIALVALASAVCGALGFAAVRRLSAARSTRQRTTASEVLDWCIECERPATHEMFVPAADAVERSIRSEVGVGGTGMVGHYCRRHAPPEAHRIG